MPIRAGMTASDVNAAIAGTFPALLGITYVEVGPGCAVATLDVPTSWRPRTDSSTVVRS
jgi:hypothetical protein